MEAALICQQPESAVSPNIRARNLCWQMSGDGVHTNKLKSHPWSDFTKAWIFEIISLGILSTGCLALCDNSNVTIEKHHCTYRKFRCLYACLRTSKLQQKYSTYSWYQDYKPISLSEYFNSTVHQSATLVQHLQPITELTLRISDQWINGMDAGLANRCRRLNCDQQDKNHDHVIYYHSKCTGGHTSSLIIAELAARSAFYTERISLIDVSPASMALSGHRLKPSTHTILIRSQTAELNALLRPGRHWIYRGTG